MPGSDNISIEQLNEMLDDPKKPEDRSERLSTAIQKWMEYLDEGLSDQEAYQLVMDEIEAFEAKQREAEEKSIRDKEEILRQELEKLQHEKEQQIAEEKLIKESNVKYEPHMRCNFCGKEASQVFLMITGPSVNICSNCVHESYKLIMDEVVRRETKLNKVVKFKEEK